MSPIPPPKPTPPEPRKARRTQAERTATARARLIEAALGVIHASGYAEATTARIQAAAGVSRGALLHHFPTKPDLMIAAAETVYAHHRAAYAKTVPAVGSPRQRLARLLDVAWDLHKAPESLALLEIWMASRGDKDLHGRFQTFEARTYAEGASGLERLLGEGALPAAAMGDLLLSAVAGIRGLAIDHALGDAEAAERGYRFLRASLLDRAEPA